MRVHKGQMDLFAFSRVLVRTGIVKPQRLARVVNFRDIAIEKIVSQRSFVGSPDLRGKIFFFDGWQRLHRKIRSGQIENDCRNIRQGKFGEARGTD